MMHMLLVTKHSIPKSNSPEYGVEYFNNWVNCAQQYRPGGKRGICVGCKNSKPSHYETNKISATVTQKYPSIKIFTSQKPLIVAINNAKSGRGRFAQVFD